MQETLALPVDPNIPLFAFIGRLDPQKGADILLEAMSKYLPHSNMQLVCLGTGNKSLEDGMRWLESTFRDKARCWVGFNVPFSHRYVWFVADSAEWLPPPKHKCVVLKWHHHFLV